MDIIEWIRNMPIEYGAALGLITCGTYYVLLRESVNGSRWDEEEK